MKYIRKNRNQGSWQCDYTWDCADPSGGGNAAVAFEGGAGAGSSACGCDGGVYAEYDFAVSGEHRVSHV